MKLNYLFGLAIALAILSTPSSPCAPPEAAKEAGLPTEDEAAARQRILQSDSWRRLMRSFDEWLSVQKVYTEPEVAQMKDSLQERVATLTAAELQDFMADTSERLDVLMSESARSARSYLGVLTQQARRERVFRSGDVPDVFDLTVSQLRDELDQLQQRRAERAAAQQKFNQAQAQRNAAAAQQRQSQAQQQENIRQARSLAASTQQQQLQERPRQAPRSPYMPRPLVTSEMVARYEILRSLRGF
ncbi:hypothetical protein [Botrimarina sp.]|uniref:hypothetical protein n=1 Tax=Botrimarina sp. TaxID=2795802 RepID=UPI0032EEF7C9